MRGNPPDFASVLPSSASRRVSANCAADSRTASVVPSNASSASVASSSRITSPSFTRFPSSTATEDTNPAVRADNEARRSAVTEPVNVTTSATSPLVASATVTRAASSAAAAKDENTTAATNPIVHLHSIAENTTNQPPTRQPTEFRHAA